MDRSSKFLLWDVQSSGSTELFLNGLAGFTENPNPDVMVMRF
jgi:hypothetical protein